MSSDGPALQHRTGLPSFDATRRLILPGVTLLRAFEQDFGVLRQHTAPGPGGWAVSSLSAPPNHVLVLVEAAQDRPYEVRFGGRRMRLAAQSGSMMVLPQGLDREWRAKERRDSVIYVNLAPDWLGRLAEEEGIPAAAPALPLLTDHADETSRMLLRLLRAPPGGPDGAASPLFLEHWTVLAALHAMRLRRAPAPGGLADGRRLAMSPARLARVKAHIEDHLTADLSLTDLAAIAGLSRFHFARAFRAETGLAPHAYVTQRRCEHAKLLLADRASRRPLAEVAVACGFAHQAHFTTVFRRATGLTPGRWRDAVG